MVVQCERMNIREIADEQKSLSFSCCNSYYQKRYILLRNITPLFPESFMTYIPAGTLPRVTTQFFPVSRNATRRPELLKT
jgi:hypothetical protein